MLPAVIVRAIEVVSMVRSVAGGVSQPRRLGFHHQIVAIDVEAKKMPVQLGGFSQKQNPLLKNEPSTGTRKGTPTATTNE